ncbi:hypothetical protein J2Z30_004069 [Streptomyces iranensis]|uniref:Uncharacterized protein n=1 Tax=Streptomyces iranensis TaxID=576784 RepID=A0ABS4MTK2_9ACTN|nr:hypothetical protein [Streptomyces iranensis]
MAEFYSTRPSPRHGFHDMNDSHECGERRADPRRGVRRTMTPAAVPPLPTAAPVCGSAAWGGLCPRSRAGVCATPRVGGLSQVSGRGLPVGLCLRSRAGGLPQVPGRGSASGLGPGLCSFARHRYAAPPRGGSASGLGPGSAPGLRPPVCPGSDRGSFQASGRGSASGPGSGVCPRSRVGGLPQASGRGSAPSRGIGMRLRRVGALPQAPGWGRAPGPGSGSASGPGSGVCLRPRAEGLLLPAASVCGSAAWWGFAPGVQGRSPWYREGAGWGKQSVDTRLRRAVRRTPRNSARDRDGAAGFPYSCGAGCRWPSRHESARTPRRPS